MVPLIRRDGDHRPDAALAQVGADRAGGIRLVGDDYVWPGSEPSATTRYTEAGHDVGEGGCVARLAAGQDEREGTTAAVGSKMDLRGQSVAGAADGVVVGFAGRVPFLRAPAACW